MAATSDVTVLESAGDKPVTIAPPADVTDFTVDCTVVSNDATVVSAWVSARFGVTKDSTAGRAGSAAGAGNTEADAAGALAIVIAVAHPIARTDEA
jgi:hypothetical protein